MTLVKKSSIYFLVIFLFTSPIFAQVPNGGFEEWGEDFPDFWKSGNLDTLTSISKSNDARTGDFAVKITSFKAEGSLFFGLLVTAEEQPGFPVFQRYESLKFHYKFKPSVSTAYLYAGVDFVKDSVGISHSEVILKEEKDVYTEITIPITYRTGQVPDLAIIAFMVTDENADTNSAGTYALIDDVSFDIVTGLDDEPSSITSYKLGQNFPNPFNPVTRINYTVPQNASGEKVTLKVYDIIGEEVASLVNEFKPAGEYTAEFNGEGLPSGIYMYRLQAGSFAETRKMTLLK